MTRLLWFLLAVMAMATLTWVVGWWMVPVVAAILTLVRRDDAAAPFLAGLAGVVAWGLILALVARSAPGGSVALTVGRALRLGPNALIAVTVAYGGLLAGTAALLTRALTTSGPRGTPTL
ncbi:MAG: hypothetical protein ACO3SD_08150 [Gemmatimonadaceae bacterium]